MTKLHHPSMRILAVAIVLGLLLVVGLASQAQAQGTPPSPLSPRLTTGTSSKPDLGQIQLTTVPGAYTVVQWRDGSGRWQDVTGWRAQATNGFVSWTVEKKDFGKGPFRWVVYSADGRTLLGISYEFKLPEAGKSVLVTVSPGSYQTPYEARVEPQYQRQYQPQYRPQYQPKYQPQYQPQYQYQPRYEYRTPGQEKTYGRPADGYYDRYGYWRAYENRQQQSYGGYRTYSGSECARCHCP